MDYINIGLRSYTIILFISTVSFIAGSNINCNGKAFHCVNSTHFKICVDLGSGVSMTVDEFLIPCPRNTVCKQYNLFECEYELTTTLPPMTTQSEVTNEQFQTSDDSVWEQLDITTIFPPKQQQGMELSEKYYNNENATPASFMSNFLTDTVSYPVTSRNTKDLISSNTFLNKSRSSNKELDISTTESGIGITQTLPYNVNSTLVPDSSSIYNTEIATTQGRSTIDSIKSKSSKPLIQNNQNQKPNQVSSVSELPYSATVILLPGNLSNSSLQENIPRISNITHLIKSDTMSQERNLDHLIKHNTTQINKSDDNTLYHNTNTDQLNLTNLNVIEDEKFTSIIAKENKKSKVNIMITPEPSTQNLAEATTSNYPTFLNTADAIETFLNEGINNTKNLEKLRVNDGEFIVTTSIIPETSVVKTNEMSSQIIQSGINYDLDNNSITITNSTKNITAEQYEGVTSLKPLSDLILKNETSPNPIIIRLTTDLGNNNITTTKPINNITERISGGDPSLKPLLDLISNNETLSVPVVVIGETGLDKNNTTTTETSKNMTAENYNRVTSLKPLSDLISKNVTRSELVVVMGETGLDNNNITTTEASKNITAGITDGVTSLKPLSDLILKNVTRSDLVVVMGETSLDNNNITTTEASKNIAAGVTDGVTSLKPLSDLISKNVTRFDLVVVMSETSLDNNNITTTETSKNITAGITNESTSLKPLSDLISKYETPHQPVVVKGETSLDNNNITTTETSKNITTGITNGGTSLKPLSDLISKNHTLSEPLVVIGETGLDKNNTTTTETIKNMTAKNYNGVTSLKPLSDLISNVTRSKPVVVIDETSLDNNNITTTETSNNITADKYSGVAGLKPLSDLISKNETSPKPIIIRLTTNLDNKNITTTEPINNITERISGDPSLKTLLDFISKNETLSEPVVVIGETGLDKNNITTTESSKNMAAENYNRVTSLKPLSDLISKNVTRSELVVVIGETGLDNNNITTTESSKNMTAENYNRVTSLKPLSDLISKNVTRSELVVVIGETGLDKNNITTTESSKNMTAENYNRVTSLKPLSDLFSKNVTRSEPVVVIGETGLDKNNITTTESSKNMTAENYNRVTSLKPLSDLFSKNVTRSEPVVVIGETGLDNNNITTTESSKNITVGITDGVTSLKPLSDLFSKNVTRSKPVVVIGETGLDKNNITTTESSKNITVGITDGVTSLKQLSDLISNVTRSKPVIVIGEMNLDNNNITTTETSNNITADKYSGVTSLKPLSDLISKNETSPKPIIIRLTTDLDNNNITTTKPINNITERISGGDPNLKPLLHLISKNETLSKPVVVIGETGLDKNNTITTETSKNRTAKNNNGVTILKPLSDSFSNVTRSEPVVVIGGADLDKNNITGKYNEITSLKPKSELISKNETWPKPIMITVATDLDNSNKSTTTEPSNNITAGISNVVTTPTSSYPDIITDIIPTTSKIQPTYFKLLMVTDTFASFPKDNVIVNNSAIFTDQQPLNEETTSLSNFNKINDYIIVPKHFNTDSIGLISSTDSGISDLKQNTTSITTRLPTTLNKPTTLTDRNSEVLGNNDTTYNSDINSVDNSLNEIINKISNVYETRTESDTSSITLESLAGTAAFKSANSMDVTINTLAVFDKLAEYTVVSDNSKTIENTSKLEFKKTTTLATYLDSNTSRKQVNLSETKTVTIRLSKSTDKELNKKGIINKNINNNDEILGKNSFGNLNLTKLSTENIFIPKLVTSNNPSLSPTLKLANANNNITDKDIEVKYNRVSNNLNEKSSKVKVINNDLNHTDNVVSSNSLSIPSSFTKQLSTAIYNVNSQNFDEIISPTRTLDKATASNKHYEIEYKKSSQINQDGNEPVPARNIEHEGKETKYLLLNPFKQVDTKAIDINDTTRTLKESYYNFSKPSITVRNNIKRDFFINNITKTSADKDTAAKDFYDTEGSGFNKRNTTTNKLVNVNNYKNRSELADYLPLNENSKDNISRNVIKPLLIVQETLENVFNKSNLHKDNENFSLIRENGLKEHVPDRLNISRICEIYNVNRSDNSAPVNNITSSNNFSKYKINNLGIVNIMIVAKPNKTFTYDRNVSEVKSISILRNRENYTNALNSSTKSSFTKNNLLRNTSSQTNSINNNKILHVLSSSALEFFKIPAEHEKSSITTSNILKMETSPLVLNRPKLDVISEQDKITISEPPRHINTNRSNGIEEQQLRNGHGYLEPILTIAKGVTKYIGSNPQNSSTALINNTNYSDTKYMPLKQKFSCINRGKYSDTNDCNKFYICIGRVKPVLGVCPKGTVFSEYLKQCTKNVTHCIRNNEFKCTAVGRFINILCNKTYFICAKKKSSFVRFTLQCQKGYYLDKHNIKCTPKLRNISISDENNSKNTKELSFSKEMEGISVNSKNVFECQKEGKFKDPQDCRKYYICKMGRESTLRRKIKKCDSDEVFHGKKKKCVDVESYECNF